MNVEELYCARIVNRSDINEHMPRLRELASECTHVTEFGVRSGNSTIAFMAGLDKYPHTQLESYDLNGPQFDPPELETLNWRFTQSDTSKLDQIDQTDMLFIDTLHDCAQVVAELKHGHKARKFIVFHDTVLFGCREESTNGEPGINHAIWCFLAGNPWWRVKEHHANNCGLLVLERE